MKVWLISELFYPEEVSTGYVMTKIAEKIAEDFSVNVICGPSEYESDVFKANYSINNSIKIHRVTVPNLNKNNLFLRIIRMLLLTFKMGIKLYANVEKGDKVILVTNPASLLVFVSFLKRFKGFKYIIIVHDVFPENLIPAGILSSKSILYRLLISIFNYAYNSANQLITVGHDMKNLISAKVNKSMKIDVIQNWADAEDIYPIIDFNLNEYYKEDFSNKIVIQFAGNIGRVQGLKDFFTLFKEANNPDLVIAIIGEGALKSSLMEMKNLEGLNNIHFYDAKPRFEQLYFLNACHIGLITLSEGMYGLGVPSKTYNILAAGKPLLFIGDKDSEISQYINGSDTGWAFTWDETEKIVKFLNNLNYSDLIAITQKGKNSRRLVNEYFTREVILNKYKQLLFQ